MKIAIIRRKFSPFGGAETFIVRAIQGLQRMAGAQQEMHITVIAESWQTDANNAQPANWHWIQAPVRGWSRAKKFLSFNQSVQHILQSNQFDLVQSHERLMGADIYRLGDGLHASWVARLANASPWYIRLWLKLDPYHRAVILTERAMSQDPHLTYVANSPLVKQELMDWYHVPESRIELIENGIDTREFSPSIAAEKAKQKQQLGLDPHLTTVLFVGSGFMRKGAFELLQAMSLLPNFQLIIIGKDKKINTLKEKCRQLALENRVHIIGPQRDVKPYLAAADLFCLPSLYDSFPNAVLEALCSGLPVVITDAVGMCKAVVDHQAGVLCEKTPQSIAQALQQAQSAQTTLSDNALKLAQHYDIELANQRWLALYQRLIRNKTKPT